MFREGNGRCGVCKDVLFVFRNWDRNRPCHSCHAALGRGRNAYICETCRVFTCNQCTNASRDPTAPRRPQRACGRCQAELVRFVASAANGPCQSCSASLEHHRFAHRCEKFERIVCTQCTSIDIRSVTRRWISPVGGLRNHKRLRLSPAGCTAEIDERTTRMPAAGTAESEVRTTEQQPVDTAGADEHERAQTADMHERAQIRYTLEIYRGARAQIRDASKVRAMGEGDVHN